jgi:hypothetical protein
MDLASAGAGMLMALVLSGCGGSGNDNANNQAANTGPSDPFFQRVLALVNSSPDNTEPTSIDDVAVTMPDNIEPASL